MIKKFSFLFFGISLFLLFVLFSWVVHKGIFTGFDFDTTVRLQDNISRRFDDLFSFLSAFGSFEPMTIFLIILLIIWRRALGFAALIFYGAIHVFELYGKTFVEHLPPPEFMLRTKRIAEFPQFYVRTEYSYPSGHAARAAFISIIIWFMTMHSKRLSPTVKMIIFGVILAYDLIMFASRIYLGEHWASDVIGGAILGVGLGLFSLIFLDIGIFRIIRKLLKKTTH